MRWWGRMLAAAAALLPLAATAHGKTIPGQYIVILKASCNGYDNTKPGQLAVKANKIRRRVAPDGEVLFTYPSIHGFAISGVTKPARLRQLPCVVSVEPDQTVGVGPLEGVETPSPTPATGGGAVGIPAGEGPK